MAHGPTLQDSNSPTVLSNDAGGVYPTPGTPAKEGYRDYANPKRDTVRAFYEQNHRFQTYDFVRRKRAEYLKLNRKQMSVEQALAFLNTLVDDSDPDIELDQLQHLLQTSEAIRADGHERWFVLVGLLHDLGKVLCLFGEPQWAVVGDTFPVGCRFSDRIVYNEFFAANPDAENPWYNSETGVYERNCGLRNVRMSWGHDEYLYHVVRDYLCDDHDRAMLPWVQKFNPYDLYSKCPTPPNWSELRPYYQELVAEYLPETLAF